MNRMLEESDLELLQSRNWGSLIGRHYGAVYALARKLLRSEADARDAAQETFARALAKLHSYDARRPLRPWLLSITAHFIRDLLRKRRELPLAPQADLEIADVALPSEPLLRQEDGKLLVAALDRLPFDWKLVVVLHFQQELAPADIAEALGVTTNAVRIRLYRALIALRKDLS